MAKDCDNYIENNSKNIIESNSQSIQNSRIKIKKNRQRK